MQREFMEFAAQLRRDYPASEPKVSLFPSGSAMLDVKVGTETYVLEYHLDVGLGLNRSSTATFGWEGYEYPFGDFEEAKTFVLSVLEGISERPECL